jgi:hypothetical protein
MARELTKRAFDMHHAQCDLQTATRRPSCARGTWGEFGELMWHPWNWVVDREIRLGWIKFIVDMKNSV